MQETLTIAPWIEVVYAVLFVLCLPLAFGLAGAKSETEKEVLHFITTFAGGLVLVMWLGEFLPKLVINLQILGVNSNTLAGFIIVAVMPPIAGLIAVVTACRHIPRRTQLPVD